MTDAAIIAMSSVAVAALSSPVITAILHRRTKAEVQDVKERIGQPNGQGDLVTMAEKLLRTTADLVQSQAGQDSRIAVIESQQSTLLSDVQRIKTNVAGMETLQLTHESRLSKLEAADSANPGGPS